METIACKMKPVPLESSRGQRLAKTFNFSAYFSIIHMSIGDYYEIFISFDMRIS